MNNMQALKKVLILSLILLMAFISANTASAAWNNTTVDNSGDVGQYPSLAIDNQDHPHISYFDNSTYDLKYASYDGSKWNIQTVDSTGQVGYYSSLALDSQDYPHISYIDYTNNALKYAAWNGTKWNIETVDSVGTLTWNTDWTTSISLDSNNYPHISYYNCNLQSVMYAHWDGTQWIITPGQYTSFGHDGRYSSIALDSSGKAHISAYRMSMDGLEYYISIPYSTIQLISGTVYFTSLAISSTNIPCISFYSVNDSALKYVTSSTWQIETVDDSGDVGQYDSLKLDSNNNPHISYQDATNMALKYAYWNGVKWQILTLDNTVDVIYTSLALDSQGIPHIAYFDGTNTALKYISAIPTVFNTRTGLGFLTIQDAIDATSTSAGDTITVGAGTYNEDVNVYKALTIIGESVTNTFVKSFNITSTGNGSDISGFSLTSGSGAAISLNNTSNCKIHDNYISGGYNKAIYLLNSSNNEIYGNLIDDAQDQNDYGIYLENSDNNTIGGTQTGKSNTITNCKYDGIYLNNSNYNTITGNKLSLNDRNGIYLENCFVTPLKDGSTANNVIESNDIHQNNDGDTGYTAGIYLKNSNNTYIHQNDIYQNLWLGVEVENSSNTIIDDNQIYENDYDGIYISTLDDGTNNTSNDVQVINNSIHDNGWSGVDIFDSDNTTVENNSIKSNGHEGVYAYEANGFTIKNNPDISNNQKDGIALVYCTDFNISGNKILGNLEDGIELDGSDNFHIFDNEIANNTNNNLYPWVGYGISAEDCHDFEIYKNFIYGNQLNGLDIWNSTKAKIHDNEIYNNQYAIYLYNDTTMEIKNNSIHDNSQDGLYTEDSQAISMLENNILNNRYGIYIQSTTDLMKINFNRFLGNRSGGIYCDNGTANATLNWWGSNSSPVNQIITGTSGTVLYDPWIILSINADTTAINYGGSTKVTADLLHDSGTEHTYHDPLNGHVPDGILIDLSTDWGNITDINPATSTTVGGKVEATYSGNGVLPIPLGPVKVYAAADNQQKIYTVVTVVKPTSTTVDPVGNYAKQSVTIKAHVTDNSNRPVNEGKLQFTINKTIVGTVNVVNGLASLNWKIPSTWKTGNYIITADYLGTTNYTISTGNNTLTVKPSANLLFNKAFTSGTHYYGDSIHYYFSVTNNGPDNATGVSVYDKLPSGLIYNISTANMGSYKINTSTWTIGTLKPGETARLDIKVIIHKLGTITNTAKLTQSTYPQTAITKTVTFNISKMITITQQVLASRTILNYYENYHTLPNTLNVAGQTITMPQFLQLLVSTTLNINLNKLNPILAILVNKPPQPGGYYTNGQLNKTLYLNTAWNIRNFINTKGRAPNYAETTLGNIPFSKLVLMYSKIMYFYGIKNRLPNYVTI